MKMKRTFFVLLVPLLLLSACGGGKGNEQLDKVDSLVTAEAFDSAYQTLMAIDKRDITTDADQAHYNLLKVRTSILIRKPLPTDSLIDSAIAYYEEHIDHEKLADAYYYKAINLKDFQQSIPLYKKAEQQALITDNKHQLFKIFEGIAFVNRMCKKNDLQLCYSKKAMEMAKALDNKNWMAYTLYTLAFAYIEIGCRDSADMCLKQIPPIIKYVDEHEKPVLLSSIGFFYRDNQPELAKKYLKESLEYQELTATYSYLAEISYEEGKKDEAYQYWKKGLLVQDATPKDNILHNIIEFDIKRGKMDSICERVNEIIAIRDSIDDKLKNDTIKDLQTRFDYEVAMHEKDQTVIRWQWALIGLFVVVVGLALYIIIKRYKEKLLLKKRYKEKLLLKNHQMQIQEYTNQIGLLKESGEGASQQIEMLSDEIKKIMDEKSPRLSQGRMLYDSIMEGRPIVKWSADDEKKFIEYFTATNYRLISRLRKEPRRENLTDHKLIYLLLKEMGKTDKEVCDIMGLSDAGLRSIRNRTKLLKDSAG